MQPFDNSLYFMMNTYINFHCKNPLVIFFLKIRFFFYIEAIGLKKYVNVKLKIMFLQKNCYFLNKFSLKQHLNRHKLLFKEAKFENV